MTDYRDLTFAHTWLDTRPSEPTEVHETTPLADMPDGWYLVNAPTLTTAYFHGPHASRADVLAWGHMDISPDERIVELVCNGRVGAVHLAEPEPNSTLRWDDPARNSTPAQRRRDCELTSPRGLCSCGQHVESEPTPMGPTWQEDVGI